MNTLSRKTLGHILAVADRRPSVMSAATARDLLMRSGLSDLEGFDDALLTPGDPEPSTDEMLRPALLSAHALAAGGNDQAQKALLEAARLVAERLIRDFALAPLRRRLEAALISDGYELSYGPPNLLTGSVLDRPARVRPIDSDAVPLAPELTALEADLQARGYTTALQHYQLAIKHFREQDHPSANSQLRSMIEELFVRLAVDHTGWTEKSTASQGTAAVKELYVAKGKPPSIAGLPLPEDDGGRMAHGIWQILHTNGSHPGLSDAEEVRIRMQLCTGLARFLLKHFPAKLTR